MFHRSFCLDNPFKRICVIGGGTMGGGIALVVAHHAKLPVTVVDRDKSICERSKATVENGLRRILKKNCEAEKMEATLNSTMERMTFFFGAPGQVASESDLIMEAIPENLEAKQQLWRDLDQIAPSNCVFASNTSSLSIAAQASVTQRPDRFGGIHFFSPVALMRLVEVISTEATSRKTASDLTSFAKELGKTPVQCKDTKGFVVNRLLVPYLLESARLVERGVASVEEVDIAMKLGAGHPMGPFTLMDSIGIDVIKSIVEVWTREEPDNSLFHPVELINRKVADGKLGRKSKEGFYKY